MLKSSSSSSADDEERSDDNQKPSHGSDEGCRAIQVDVIIPVHNSAETVVETVQSAMAQHLPERFQSAWWGRLLSVHVCCYDDGSADDSWKMLQELQTKYNKEEKKEAVLSSSSSSSSSMQPLPCTLHIERSKYSGGQGPGYARNRAVDMRKSPSTTATNCRNSPTESIQRLLCWLDSDDTMHSTRVAEQVAYLLNLPPADRSRTLLGCTFDRDPPDATWHYAAWANGLTDERLVLEQFRELTLLQPTWMMSRDWFVTTLGGYSSSSFGGVALEEKPKEQEAPASALLSQSSSSTVSASGHDLKVASSICSSSNLICHSSSQQQPSRWRLIHPTYDTAASLRIAEDLRLFHEHLHHAGSLRLLRTKTPLVTYRHQSTRPSQSSLTPRKLLLHLRAYAFEQSVLLCNNPDINSVDNSARYGSWLAGPFCIWGAGRDGKDLIKALSPEVRRRVYCLADVDDKKITGAGYYVNRQLDLRIPIIHFSLLARNPVVRRHLMESWQQQQQQGGETNNNNNQYAPGFGRIDKSKPGDSNCNNNNKSTAEANSTNSRPPAKGHVLPTPSPALPSPMKRRKLHADCRPDELDLDLLPKLPVVVCVAMYRTNGALEHNVSQIGRTEGKDLWHFS